MLTVAMVVAACGSKHEESSASAASQSAQMQGQTAPVASEASPPAAPAVTRASWAPDALEELLAPIALYPDALLGQVLAASVNSQEVLDGGNWLLQNQNLQGDALDKAAQTAGFGPAMRALLQYPTVVDMMCQEMDWTRQLGSAFSSDQTAVLDAVQRLRQQAAEVGNLKSTPQQTVETKTENDKVVVEVQPADPRVVYVPAYDPQAVYTTPPPPPAPTTTVVEEKSGVSTGALVATGLIAFGLGVMVGDHHDDYYYPHWGSGAVYFGPRPFYPPAYVYRPAYGPAFRPAYGYAPPPNYRYNYRHVDVHDNININVNNNYYNRFSNNQNLRADGARSPLGSAARAHGSDRPGPQSNWKGQSTYAGTRDTHASERLQQAAGEKPRPNATSPSNRAATQVRSAASARNAVTANRQVGDRSAPRPAPAKPQHLDRGYGNSTRDAHPDLHASQQSASQRRDTRSSAPARDNAFSGAGQRNNGSFERSASARGRASMGAHGGGHRRR